MPEITEELIRIKARESIIHLVENCEFLDLVEDTDLDARFGDLTPDEAEGAAQRVGEAIDTATVTVTWPDRLPGVDGDEHALLDILETGAYDGPAMVMVLRSIDGGPDFADAVDAFECQTFVDRLLEWKNNAVAAAIEGVNALGAEATRGTDPKRAQLIADARAVLDLIEANPALPFTGLKIAEFPRGTDEQEREQVDTAAAALGADTYTTVGGHYEVETAIGASNYRVIAITEATMARHNRIMGAGREVVEAAEAAEHAATEIPEAVAS